MPSQPRYEDADVEGLTFDPQNPRLPTSVDGSDESAVIDWMLRDASLIELMGSIGEHGYFPGEALLVVRRPEPEEGFTVIEGNRRLAAVKLLRDPSLAGVRRKAAREAAGLAKHKPRLLPIAIFARRAEILDYLGYRHITGVKDWKPLAKAKYLSQLAQRHKGPDSPQEFQDLARGIGSRSDYVARLLTAYRLYQRILDKDFFDIRGLDEASMEFTLLSTALSYHSISSFLGLTSAADTALSGLDTDRLRELTTWLFERNSEGNTRVGESRNLKQLAAVLEPKFPVALASFRRGEPLEEAARLTELPLDVFRTCLMEARSRLQTALGHIRLVDSPDKSDADTLTDIRQLSQDLLTLVNKRIADSDEE
jgi:hypothetical protein